MNRSGTSKCSYAMRCRHDFRRMARAAVLLTLAGTLLRAQEVVSADTAISADAASSVALVDATSQGAQSPDPPSPASSNQDETAKNPVVPCLEPPPVLRWRDYQGPFQKVVGAFARKLELKSAHPPRYKPGTVLCSLEVKDKFTLFVQDTFDPISFLSAAFFAGLDQSANRDPMFGQGAEGYGKRFGAAFADQTTWRFFTDFAYPTIFAEDPRYYRMINGSSKRRFFHAIEHTFVAQHDSGKPMFKNFDMTFNMSFMPEFKLPECTSVDMVSGGKPCFTAGAATLNSNAAPPCPTSKRMPRLRASRRYGSRRPFSSKYGTGA